MIDYAARLADARKSRRCAECRRNLLPTEAVRGGAFCSERCRDRLKGRRRYARDPEKFLAKSRAYREANRDLLLAKAAAKRGAAKARREEVPRHCVECGTRLVGRQKILCSQTCTERRWRRLNPEAARERERKKSARRRERRKGDAA